MRQFLLAGNVAYGESLPLAAGAVAFTYLKQVLLMLKLL